eukprot:s2158_g6.t1
MRGISCGHDRCQSATAWRYRRIMRQDVPGTIFWRRVSPWLTAPQGAREALKRKCAAMPGQRKDTRQYARAEKEDASASALQSCRHFFSERGCSRGDKCRFEHATGAKSCGRWKFGRFFQGKSGTIKDFWPPNVSSYEHRPRRHRRLRRFRRFGRYGATTTAAPSSGPSTTTIPTTSTSITTTTTTTTTTEEPTTTMSSTTTTEEPTTTTSTTTSTTRVNCQGGSGRNFQQLTKTFSGTPTNTITLRSTITPPDCTCVGDTGGSVPAGYLYVELAPNPSRPPDVPVISVTSPNLTEIKLNAVVQIDRISNVQGAGTTAFNGFAAEGDWVVKFLDGSDNPVNISASRVFLTFGIQNCAQVLPAAPCVGNSDLGDNIIAENTSLVNTNISSNTLVSQGLLRQQWKHAGLRAIAEETLLSGARLCRAFANLDATLSGPSAGSQDRGHGRSLSAKPRGEQPLRSRSPVRDRRPPLPRSPARPAHGGAETKGKKDQESEDFDEEEEEEEEEDLPDKVVKREPDGGGRPPEPEDPPQRRKESERPREHERSSRSHREPRSSEHAPRSHKPKEKNRRRRRGGAKHQRRKRDLVDPFRRSHRKIRAGTLDLATSLEEGLSRRH